MGDWDGREREEGWRDRETDKRTERETGRGERERDWNRQKERQTEHSTVSALELWPHKFIFRVSCREIFKVIGMSRWYNMHKMFKSVFSTL